MEQMSGILKTRLSREHHSECLVFVIATSFVKNKPLQAITEVLVRVIDINDNDPNFDLQLYHKRGTFDHRRRGSKGFRVEFQKISSDSGGDGDGKPKRLGNTTVVIKIMDEDNNAPRFSKIFHVKIPENVAIGLKEDISFQVEEETGMVSVNDTLDYEKQRPLDRWGTAATEVLSSERRNPVECRSYIWCVILQYSIHISLHAQADYAINIRS
ncbi:hypothetical protein GCK72_026106 [Caenorhabditis remanei]|uniref:Cadherin domain-containing protein n=1 Tax=Caenorhabditis remanei TaxID=31234 RepID=A0A6A5G3R7_CAERE|nr:hypothetical protein GCK72_026106 [Caenorhabditis remanei]KAF1749638.1 hypothetical protein GCK72_026106 [Caenorhabditis remanei]